MPDGQRADSDGFGSGVRRRLRRRCARCGDGPRHRPAGRHRRAGAVPDRRLRDLEGRYRGAGRGRLRSVGGASPPVGRFVDGLGDRGPLLAVLAIGAASLVCCGGGPDRAVMVVALAVRGALPRRLQPGHEPGDQRADRAGSRGWITGVKQIGRDRRGRAAAARSPPWRCAWGGGRRCLARRDRAGRPGRRRPALRVQPPPSRRPPTQTRRGSRGSIRWLNAYNLAMGARDRRGRRLPPAVRPPGGELSAAAAGGDARCATGVVGGFPLYLGAAGAQARWGYPGLPLGPRRRRRRLRRPVGRRRRRSAPRRSGWGRHLGPRRARVRAVSMLAVMAEPTAPTRDGPPA